jgi:hypothetical protein
MTMMRQMHVALGKLERRQVTREKAEAEMQPAAMQRAGWWFREATVPAEPAPPPGPEPATPPQEFGALTEAEQYAVLYPERAARIRAAVASRRPSISARPRPRSSTPWSAAPVRSCRRSTDLRLSRPTRHNLANTHNETNPDTFPIGWGGGAPPARPAPTLSPLAGRA